MKEQKIIATGAEAILIQQSSSLIKKRIKKSYRLPTLDEKIRKLRTRRETKLLGKASSLIPIPKVHSSSEKTKEIQMDFIQGKKLSDHLDSLPNSGSICLTIGKHLAKLHDSGIIHGDLTTSNMILSEKGEKVYFIDFGLGFISNKIEDKAVDLHLIKEALEAKHFENSSVFFSKIKKGYETSENFLPVLKQLEKVELRGRYKKSN